MGRRYTADGFAALVRRARAAIPGLAVTADIIAGLPGETEDEHRQSVDFARDIGFARMHVFPYSARKGTRAAAMDGQVPPESRLARARELLALSAAQEREFSRSQVGRVVDVLWEERLPAAEGGALRWTGHAANYLRVTAESDADLPNIITPVRITRAVPGGALGEIVAAGVS
jgi:threonylcarbamoyladenosine tRNA methylthiotransferase MtaB